MRTFRATVQYDGTEYAGFQRQRAATTVQGALESAIAAVTGEESFVDGAGRTDAGVHARGQVVSFRTSNALEASVLLRALNARLPQSIVVQELSEAREGFHARYDAVGRTYEYVIYNQALPSPFWRRYAWHVREPLDVELMRQSLLVLQGEQDFASFGRPMAYTREGITAYGSTVRHLGTARCWADESLVRVLVEANAFLRQMVRRIVGTAVQVGRRRLTVQDMVRIVQTRQITAAGPVAPAHGLYLVNVLY